MTEGNLCTEWAVLRQNRRPRPPFRPASAQNGSFSDAETENSRVSASENDPFCADAGRNGGRGRRFCLRTAHSVQGHEAQLVSKAILRVEHVKKTFGARRKSTVTAVDDVSFSLGVGGCLGIVGESGSGKSTLANMILRFFDVSDGKIEFSDKDITHTKGKASRGIYRDMQAVFQNPVQSFDPRRTIGHGVCEGARNCGLSKQEASARARKLFTHCGLEAELLGRYPREVSGGQCQRAAIARALMMDPKLLICDEATSALDMTEQKQVVELLAGIQRERNMAMLVISHDIALVCQLCDRVLVMKEGRIIEQGETGEVLSHPQHYYTRALIEAVL